MLQVVQPTPVEEAIKALEAARAKAQCEVIKLDAALHQLRPNQIAQSGAMQSGQFSPFQGIGGLGVGPLQGGNAQ